MHRLTAEGFLEVVACDLCSWEGDKNSLTQLLEGEWRTGIGTYCFEYLLLAELVLSGFHVLLKWPFFFNQMILWMRKLRCREGDLLIWDTQLINGQVGVWSSISMDPRALRCSSTKWQNAVFLAKWERASLCSTCSTGRLLGVLEGLSPSPSPPVILCPGHSTARASPSSGIPTVPGKVTLQKDAQNLIGISIGGGAQYCPCLYIVQVLSALEAGGRCWRGRATSLLGHDKGSFLHSVKLALYSLQRGFPEYPLSVDPPLFFCHFNLFFFLLSTYHHLYSHGFAH